MAEEINEIVTRLTGDDSSYRKALQSSAKLTEKWENEVSAVTMRHHDKIIQLTERTELRKQEIMAAGGRGMATKLTQLHNRWEQSVKDIERTTVRGLQRVEARFHTFERQINQSLIRSAKNFSKWLKIGAGFIGFGTIAAAVRTFTSSWQEATKAMEDAERASHLFTQNQIEDIQDAQSALAGLKREWDQWHRDLAAGEAPAIEGAANFLGGALQRTRDGMEQILALLATREFDTPGQDPGAYTAVIEDQVRKRLAARNAPTEAEQKEKKFREKVIAKSLDREKEEIQRLQVELGLITEEQAAWNDLLKEAGDSASKIGVQHREALEAQMKQRKELEKQVELKKEQERLAKEIARDEERAAKEYDRATKKANERRAKEAQDRQMEGMDEIMERAKARADRLLVEDQIETLVGGGKFSAGAAIEAGSEQARSLTKFGTAGETMVKLLNKLNSLEEKELGLQERATKGIEAMQQNIPVTVTIA